ncbi:MAG: hypothetical protein C0597_03940 [Marinilabiliales bacterium]|nr:MAG: hypothetical protein C0597_03940 [Marinilabiliales bacterium]
MCTIWFIQSGSVQAQVINNQGAVISVTGGTFVQGDTLENTAGTISNDGIIQLNGHYINIGTTQGNGIYNLKGNWINTGTFTPGNSTVRFNGTNFQLVQTSGDPFFHFILNNTGAGTNNRIILSDNVTVSDSLDLISGNIQTDANILYLEEQTPASLDYSSSTGSRIIGKFERGVSELDNYLFPIGSGDHYNPMNLTFNDVAAGSILSEFVANDPDSIGLPLPDPGYVIPTDTVEVYNTDSTGYWSVTAKNLFTSTDFDVNLSGSGFSEVQNASRIIKRTAPANDWILEGIHKDGADSVANRNTLIGVDGAPGHHFGWGHIRPRIQTQPEDTAICDGESATFSIVATGRGTLSYEWEVLERSGGWIPISDDATYANSATDTLLIIAADTSMSGYKYRVIVTDSLGNFHRSNSQATLTVNPRPVATATPQQDTICNGETTFIDINSTVPGTTYSLEVLYFGSITGASTTLVDDTTIQQTLTNLTLYADSVIYRIFPTGPFSTQCGGTADTVIIWVEPTVIISAVSDTICNRDFTNIDIRSENVTTNGIHYTWTATATDLDVSGFTNNAVGQDTLLNITDQLVNVGVDSAIVHYTITPWTLDASGNLKCSGTPTNIDIWVEPTVEINALNDTICDVTSTNITVTSPNTTTNGIRFTWTVLDNPNITGETNSAGNGQNIGTAITQTLTNTSFSKQLVQYTITPWSVNASNENECTDAAEVITIDIWVDPTPRVFTSIVRDTICNDTRTNITLTTPNVMTVGVVTFDYNSLADAGLTGNSKGITNLNDSYVITDSLHNSTTFPAISPQVVRYTITPRSLATGCANGPNVIDSITVHPTAYTNFNPIDSVRCFGESNGSANVVARNGVNIFTYLWNDPLNQTDSTAIGLSQGDYIVTVTDNQSCIKIDTVTIDEPDILVPVVDTIRDVSCNGQGDGFIIMLPTGGNSQYRYTWKKGSNPPFVVDGLGVDSVGGLNGATYYVTVTDWKGCTDNTSAEVIEPPQTAVEVISDNVRCYGENNGSATANAPGFTNYVWSTGATTASITNLSPNVYTVTATNPEGCTKTGIANITEPDLIQIDSIVSTIISCEGDADGTIELNVIGGNTIVPYTYNWSTPDGSGLVVTDEDQSGLSGGTYFVTINDWRLCTVDTFAIVSEPGEYDSEIQVTDVTCFEDADGTIDLVVTGGNSEGTYEYNWVTADGNGLTQGIEDQSGLSGGTYYVTITDSKDCEIYNTASIFEPDLLEAIISETNSTCFGNEDGTAVVDIFGGNGGYSISWSPNGETVDSIYGLSSGTYQVNVIDSEGCVASNEVEISEPDEILNDVSFENITCFGYGNGQIIITPQGGITPYTYQWSHSGIFTDSLATNLDPGSYSISVVDKNNCLEVSSVDITQPDPLTLTATKEDITCYGLDDGYITLSMFGGTPDYNYNWSNGFTTNSGDQLTPGTYQINISDLHNCQVDTNIVIEEPDKLIITPVVVRPTCPDIQDGSIDLNITGGRTPYMIYWDDGNNQENLTEIRSGIYEVVVNDSSLCEVDSVFVVRSAFDDCIDIPTAFTPNNDGINDTWVIDMQGLYPDAEVQVFDRWGKIVFYSKGYEESQYWDGTYNGKQLPMDAYYYIIYLKNGAERLSGSITIIR